VAILQSKKNIIFYSSLSLCLLLWSQSCKKTPAKNASQPHLNKPTESTDNVLKEQFPILNSSTSQEFTDWNHYLILDAAIKNLENGDATFFKQPIEDLNQLFLNIKKSVPNPLKINSILARVKVTETLARKLNELYSVEDTDFIETEQTISNLIESHNNLIFQINKTREKEAQRISKPD